MAHKESRAEPLLQCLDLMGNGSWGHTEFVCCLREALMTARCLKRPKRIERRHSGTRRIDGHRMEVSHGNCGDRRIRPPSPLAYLSSTGASSPSTAFQTKATNP